MLIVFIYKCTLETIGVYDNTNISVGTSTFVEKYSASGYGIKNMSFFKIKFDCTI